MELYKPRLKKNRKFKKYIPEKKTSNKIQSIFDGFSVIIENQDDMKRVYQEGFFGKGNLSRSCPVFQQNCIIRKRQYLHRKAWEISHEMKPKIRKVIVVPDSDTDDENYFVSLKPEYEIDRSEIKEKLYLTLVEAYYLAHNVGYLNIYEKKVRLENEIIWRKFSESDIYFIPNYIAYRHFRRKGWVVKSGIKFGGDYILYKGGPPYYHASYVVIIDIMNEELVRMEEMSRRSMDIVNVMGLNRLCETAGKELLICQIIWPKGLSPTTDDDLQKISINEILVRRWVANQD